MKTKEKETNKFDKMLSRVFAKGKGSTQICPQQNSTVTLDSSHGITGKCQMIWKISVKIIERK